ncbi:MAG: aminopeptidase P family protein [Thermoguttaceae bacterium]|nr:aminopeptidase P family protein [Planctomycetaceae bacterium]MBQ4144000.1 aminopeptidase P family protein [Thermoguttaceae bacterium]
MSDIFASRREKLRKLLKKQNADAILITNFTNVTWLTGFTGDDSWLFLSQSGECLLSDSRYTIQIEQECPGLAFRLRGGKMTFPVLIREELEKLSLSARLGLESRSVTYAEAERLRKDVTENIVPLGGLTESLREVKDRHEIQIIRDSAKIARNAFHAVRALIRPDWTEKQVADELEFAMRRLGAKDASFPTIAAVGSNAALPHCVPGDRKVGDANFILIDWGAKYRGYASDLTRVLFTGKVSAEFRKVYQIVLDAQKKAIDAVRPGIPCSEIDAVARQYIDDAGYGKCFGHGLGHGIGLEIHEGPSFSPASETILKPGMVLTVEPGIYVKGWGGVRIEDDVVVTRSGYELLTDVEKEFDEMFVD